MKQQILAMKSATPVSKKEQKGISGGITCNFECLSTGVNYDILRECIANCFSGRCSRECSF